MHIPCKGTFELYAYVLDQVLFRFCLGKGFLPKENKADSERLLCKMISIVLFKSSETFQGDLHVSCTVQLNYILGRPWSHVRQYKKADVQQIHLSAKKLLNHETPGVAQILNE